jgi:hypothetical protein
MWALVIVVGAPCRNCAAGMAQRREQVLVEALFAHSSVEAFHQTVLHGFAGGSVLNFVYLGWPMRVSDTVTH